MKTFSMFFSEDAGEKFNKMDDDQFANWKKANPGAAEKADKLRSAKKESGLQKNDAKKELPTSAITAPKGGALAKHRKSEMGKWSQGIKNAPGKLAKKAAGSIVKDAVQKAKVKMDDAQAGNRPGSSRPSSSSSQKSDSPAKKQPSSAEQRAAEKHEWAREARDQRNADRAERKAAKSAKQAEKDALEAKKATRKGREELQRAANKKKKESEKAKWDAKVQVPAIFLDSIGSGRCYEGRKVCCWATTTGEATSSAEEGGLQGNQQRSKGVLS